MEESFDGTIGGGDGQPCAALGSNPVLVCQHGTRRKDVLESKAPVCPKRAKMVVDFQSGFMNGMTAVVEELLAVP